MQIDNHNIISLGEEAVTREIFIRNLKFIANNSESYETILFYFSGHGVCYNNKNYLVLADTAIDLIDETTISIDYVLDTLKNIKVKNKILIIDSCHAGIHLGKNVLPSIDIKLEEQYSEGWSIFASCKREEFSYIYEAKGMSVFSYFLCEALNGNGIKKKRVSLEDIRQFVTSGVAHWARENNHTQTPNMKGERVGTVYFTINNNSEVDLEQTILEESVEYKYISLEDVSHAGAKRNSAKVIINKNITEKFDIYRVIEKIIQDLKKKNIYTNTRIANYWSDKDADIVWIYIGYDEEDIRHCNWAYSVQWVRDDLDDNYKIISWKDKCDRISSIEIQSNSMYKYIKSSIRNNTNGNIQESIELLLGYVESMTGYADKVIDIFEKFKDNNITEEDLFTEMREYCIKISSLFIKTSDLPFAPSELDKFDKACVNLFSTIYDFSLFYNINNKDKWNSKNRMFSMSQKIEDYNKSIEKLRLEYSKLDY